MYRSVCTMSRFYCNSSGLVPRFLVVCNNSAPKTATLRYVSSSNLRCSSKTSTPAPSGTAKDKITPVKEESSVDEAKKTTPPSAIDLALNSVVKVFTVSSKPRLFQPWQISMQNECSGSGFLISGKKIITNAHVVDNHTSVKVQKHGSATMYKAKVRMIGHECDLAILEVDNDEFWEGMKFLELGDVPKLQEEVHLVGYPCGGDSISVTKGVVSRVELKEYSHSSTELLTIQIDAAINSGNSGGPVFLGNKVAGVAFEGLFWSDGIGYMIPTPVVKHFLDCVEEKHVSFGSMNISYQTMGNAQIRDYFKMSKDMTGILVNEINPLSDAYNFLKKDDVILAIDGVPIGNDSKVPFLNQDTVDFKHLVSMKKPSETALIKVLREGKECEFNVGLKPVKPLVPLHNFDKMRSYYVYGGFLFVPLSQPYIDGSDIEQIVIISQILEDDINAGYASFEDLQVKKVNGIEVDNLKHLCQVIEECSTGFLRLDLENEKVLILNNKLARKANSTILKELKIPSAMSDDLQPRQVNRSRLVSPRHSKKNN
ncbi:BnaA04g15270D [Brassica napus]|uniref:BnaA04g15270D protein n=1 Tax=Brassica napus TaxID=3708 RepID=A0A078HA29_BRANA|nr:BnaA04g15270D [Brassica napus]